MIDKLVLRCEFNKVHNDHTLEMDWPSFELETLSIPLSKSIDKHGDEFDTRHPWESIPSDYEGMAFKVNDHRYDKLDSFYIEIKASPAKLMQGHNVFGSLNFEDCFYFMVELLYTTYPTIADKLNPLSWYLSAIDLTFSSRAKSNHDAKQFINALGNVSFGQTKARTGFDGTVYFGKKNSRLRKIKVYAKGHEVVNYLKSIQHKPLYNEIKSIHSDELMTFATGLIRWETTLMHRWLERKGISCYIKDIFENKNFSKSKLIDLWKIGTNDLFESLKGEEMKVIDDKKIHNVLRTKFHTVNAKGKISYSKADAAFRTLRALRNEGWFNLLETMNRATFYRHVKLLTECGLSRAVLQNLDGVDQGATVIPFIRYISVDFETQVPEWAKVA